MAAKPTTVTSLNAKLSTALKKSTFTKIQAARQLLRERAEEILNDYLAVVNEARAEHQPEVAIKALQWLIEHMPADEDGGKPIDTSIDKNIQPVQVDSRPAIQIGIQLGGVNIKQKALPKASAEVIDAK